MKSKFFLMLIILFQVYSVVFSQNDTNNFVLKTFYNMSKSYNHTTNYFLTVPTIYRPEVLSDENEFSQGYFSVSFEKNTKKGNSTEFELMPFRYNKYETINTLIKDSSNITKEIVSLNVVSFETYGKYFYYYQFCKF